jgi:hypothetical protein
MRKRLLTPLPSVLMLLLATLVFAQVGFGQCVSLTGICATYTQNFDTLSNTAGSTTNNLTITGWFLTEGGGCARDNEQCGVDTGGSTIHKGATLQTPDPAWQ